MRLAPLASLVCLVCLVSAEDELLGRLRQMASDHPTVRITFEQSKDLAIFAAPVVTSGLIEIDRGRSALRWEFTGRAVFILADGRLRKWDAEGREETGLDRDGDLTALKAQMGAMLTGDWSVVAEQFHLSTTADPPTLTLAPRDAGLARHLTRVVMRFEPTDLSPKELVLEAAGDDRTTYRFAAPVADPVIAAERFTGP